MNYGLGNAYNETDMSTFGKDWKPARSERADVQFAARVELNATQVGAPLRARAARHTH